MSGYRGLVDTDNDTNSASTLTAIGASLRRDFFSISEAGYPSNFRFSSDCQELHRGLSLLLTKLETWCEGGSLIWLLMWVLEFVPMVSIILEELQSVVPALLA